MAVQHLKTQPKPLESIRPDLPPALCRLVHSMLVKSPDRRCASAREIVREVRRVQLEYGGEDLPEDLPGWDSLAGDFPADPRIAATQQLGELMKTLAMQQPKRRRLWKYAAGLAARVSRRRTDRLVRLGRSIALGRRRGTPSSRFPTATSAAQQYLIACRFGTEEAWKSVIANFGDDKTYAPRAREQLALIYLDRRDYARALEISDELVGMGKEWEEYKAFGLAVRVVAYAFNHQDQKSAQALNEFDPLWPKLKNPTMRELVDYVTTTNRPSLDSLKTGTE